jgi:putative holliday junction resolvase
MPDSVVRHASYLCFDYGQKRIGVASGNTLTRSAQALQTKGNLHFDAIAALIKAWQPDALVIGVPFYPDGNAHINTERARQFAQQLRDRYKHPVHEVDERYSTTEAKAIEANPSRQGHAHRKAGLDAAAAAIILEQFLQAPE